MSEFAKRASIHEDRMRDRYDVVIIGGGGHGLAAAYYLAKQQGISNVAVLERGYIGVGNTGRNTTIVRANYNAPETIKFNHVAAELYRTLSQELNFNVMRSERGLLWMAHSEAAMRTNRERAIQNQCFGVNTVYLDADEVHKVCPQLDMTAGGHRPIIGAAYHLPGSTVRHDAVVWGYTSAAQRLGVHVHQGVEVTGVNIKDGRCLGVETSKGSIQAGAVMSAVGGYVSNIARMTGLKLPIVSHPLQAFVTESYKPALDRIVASQDIGVYVSQSPRGEFVVGAEINPYTSYSTRSTFPFLASTAARAIDLFPFMAKLKILRQWTGVCDMTPDYSPLMGMTEIENFYLSSGWGTWGFKAIPASGVAMAELIASKRVPELIAPFALSRFYDDRAVSERSSAGTH